MGDLTFIPLTHSCGEPPPSPRCQELLDNLDEAQQELDQLNQLVRDIRDLITAECPGPEELVPVELVAEIIRIEHLFVSRSGAIRKLPI